MSVRKATLSDVDGILALGMRVKPRTVYATVPVDKVRAHRTCRQCISAPTAFAMVHDDAGKIDAALLGVTEEMWFSSRREAKDIVFVSENPMASCALVEEFKAWSWRDPRVAHCVLAQSSGVNVAGTERWMERMGFERVGGVFMVGRWDVEGQKVAL